MKTLIYGGTIVNDGRAFQGSLVVENGYVAEIFNDSKAPRGVYDTTVDAMGLFVIPGVIDSHVHFRDPGLTQKADIESESRAAAYGGVTSYFDMPNTVPQTTTLDALDAKFSEAAQRSHVNYSFFIGATNDNLDQLEAVNRRRVPGVKLFMGSSTGNMLVDREEALRRLFANIGLPIMSHCEDTATINANMAACKLEYGDDPDVRFHPAIRSAEACYRSTKFAVELAREYGAHLHVAHVTTARELEFFGVSPNITAEAVVAHLFFCDEDYARLGTRIKCNPAIKTRADRDALRAALSDGRITTIGTDHAPHLLADKQGGCARAASGMPMVQFSLPAMLQLVDSGVLTIERMVQLMCHNPARLFGVDGRGFLNPGCRADIVLLRPNAPWTVTTDIIQSKCKWSPLEGHQFDWRVETTFCNGNAIYNRGHFCTDSKGEEISFR